MVYDDSQISDWGLPDECECYHYQYHLSEVQLYLEKADESHYISCICLSSVLGDKM